MYQQVSDGKARPNKFLQDFFFSGGSPTTPAHRCKDFYFKTYAPRAFKRFRNEFGIEADNFLVILETFYKES